MITYTITLSNGGSGQPHDAVVLVGNLDTNADLPELTGVLMRKMSEGVEDVLDRAIEQGVVTA